jgi:hypothetical protein
MTLLFVVIMAILIKFSTQRFWLIYFLILGLATQAGYQIGIIGVAVWMGLGKILHDLFYARRS